MSNFDLAAVRQAVVDTLQAGIPNLTASPRRPAPISPPHAWIDTDLTVDWDDFGASRKVTFTLVVVVSGTVTDAAHDLINEFISTGSIDDVLNGSLSGQVMDCSVGPYTNIGAELPEDGITYLGFNVGVEILV